MRGGKGKNGGDRKWQQRGAFNAGERLRGVVVMMMMMMMIMINDYGHIYSIMA